MQELREAEAVELAKQKLAEQELAREQYKLSCITYEQFIDTVYNKYKTLEAGWHKVLANSVLPPERHVVKLKHNTRSGAGQGYWFMPQGYLASEMPFAEWRERVRWKSLNGYGVDAIAWLNDVYVDTMKEVFYEQ